MLMIGRCTYLHYTRHRNAIIFRISFIFVVRFSPLVRPGIHPFLSLHTSFAVLSYTVYALLARSDHSSLQALMDLFTFYLVLAFDARSGRKRAVALYQFIRVYSCVLLKVINVLGEIRQ